jgi:hypothetical protein
MYDSTVKGRVTLCSEGAAQARPAPEWPPSWPAVAKAWALPPPHAPAMVRAAAGTAAAARMLARGLALTWSRCSRPSTKGRRKKRS